ncbi:hypothetical protein EHM92_09485 [bacterium]|nr:MAG: hypothetical protein EHM92_09485 [bacterium]
MGGDRSIKLELKRPVNDYARSDMFDTLSTVSSLATTDFMPHSFFVKKEFIFNVEQDEDMLVAICPEPEMATQGQDLEELILMIRDLIQCRFEEGDERTRWPIRLHFLDDPVLQAPSA